MTRTCCCSLSSDLLYCCLCHNAHALAAASKSSRGVPIPNAILSTFGARSDVARGEVAELWLTSDADSVVVSPSVGDADVEMSKDEDDDGDATNEGIAVTIVVLYTSCIVVGPTVVTTTALPAILNLLLPDWQHPSSG